MKNKRSVIFKCVFLMFSLNMLPMGLVKKMAAAVSSSISGAAAKEKDETKIRIKIKNQQEKEIEIEIGLNDDIEKLAQNYGKSQGYSGDVISKLRFQYWQRTVGVRGQGIGVQYSFEDIPQKKTIREFMPNIQEFGLLFSYTQP